MMGAVRRKDDGPLTKTLSILGWSSLLISRILVFTFAAAHLKSWIFIFCLVHVLAITVWVYKIAIESHQQLSTDGTSNDVSSDTRKRSSLALLVFLFFGIPSLVFWPIMFQLKQKRRPLIFLLIMAIENLFLLGLWFIIELSTVGQLTNIKAYIVAAIVCLTVSGCLFLSGYIFCKPKFTDEVVLHDIRQSRAEEEAEKFISLNGISSKTWNATKYGIYYEFCDLVFNLPASKRVEKGLQEVRQLQRPS